MGCWDHSVKESQTGRCESRESRFYLGMTATHEKRTQSLELGLDSKYMRDKWEYTIKEQGVDSGWKNTKRKHHR